MTAQRHAQPDDDAVAARRDGCTDTPGADSDDDRIWRAADEVPAAGWRDEAGRLVAAVRVRVRSSAPAVAEIGRLTVVPDRQGQGLGSSLFTAVEGQLPASVAELRLFTGEHSEGNLRLYERLGYTETHREATPAGYALVHFIKYRGWQQPGSA